MLYKTINKTEPIILFLILFIVLAWSVIYLSVLSSIDWYHNRLFLTISIGLTFVGLMFLYQHTLRRYSFNTKGYITLLIFVLLCISFSNSLEFDRVTLSFILHMMMLRHILNLQDKKRNVITNLFDAGIYAGVSFVLFPFSVLYIPLIYIGYFLFTGVNVTRLFIPIIGFIVPVFLTYTYFVWFADVKAFNSLIALDLNHILIPIHNLKQKFGLIIFSLITLVSLILMISKTFTSSNVAFQKYKLIILHLIISLTIVLISSEKYNNNIIFLFFPISIIISQYVIALKKYWLKESVLWLMIVVCSWQVYTMI